MERIYNIPLRREFQKAPSYKRAGKATRALREFLIKHMKAKEVKIGKFLNQEIWKNGPKNPPHKVNVKAIKDGDLVKVELVDAPIEAPEPKKEEKKKTKKKEDLESKTEKPVKEPKKEEKKETKKEKVPSAKELAEKKETKKKEEKKKKVPSATELKEKKSSKK